MKNLYMRGFPLRIAVREVHSSLNDVFWDTVHINEYPKSGGTWLSNLIADSVEYDFRDNKLPKLGNSVIKHHRMRDFNREVVMFRDPRSVAISFYHHCSSIFGDKNGFNYKLVSLMQQTMDACNGKHDRIPFFERMIYSPIYPRFKIEEFYCKKKNANIKVFYEDLRVRTDEVLAETLEKLSLPIVDSRMKNAIHKNSLALSKTSTKGNTFVRKGKVDSWKDELSSKEKYYLNSHLSEIIGLFNFT